jgi:phosphoglycolate phosphatase
MTDGRLADVLHRARALLLDFDGPVCSIFAGNPALEVTARLRPLMPDGGAELAAEAGPHDALFYATRFSAAVVRRIEQELHDAEMEAADTAAPTPGAAELLHAARGMPVAIVSNNASHAITRYLTRNRLNHLVDHVEGRSPTNPWLMKPSPVPVWRSVRALKVSAHRSVLIGDSESDVRAAQLGGAMSIGYANKPGKLKRLTTCGTDAIVTNMAEVTQQLMNR